MLDAQCAEEYQDTFEVIVMVFAVSLTPASATSQYNVLQQTLRGPPIPVAWLCLSDVLWPTLEQTRCEAYFYGAHSMLGVACLD
jgi:hypothetical protein